MARETPVNSRVTANPDSPSDWSLNPSPTPGFQTPGNPAPNPAPPGFTPRQGEGNAAARMRVIDAVLDVATRNGQEPSRNG